MKDVYNERIDKILSACGIMTRREAKEAARKGRITVDGVKINDSGKKITQDNVLAVDGNTVAYSTYVYVILNKPKGYVCTTDSRDGTPVLTLFEGLFGSRNVSPVGRLDKDTTGALLLTDNGKLGHALLTPQRHVEKEYMCETLLPVSEDYVSRFKDGVDIGEPEKTAPAKLIITGENTALLTVTEGKFHQVKRMFAAVGNKITGLHRTKFASIPSPENPGEWRFLSEEEIELLFGLACQS